MEIKETTRPVQTVILHKGRVSKGRIREGEQLHMSVNANDAARRSAKSYGDPSRPCRVARSCWGRMSNNMAHWSAPNRLRFDFAHFRPLSSRDIDEIETVVNDEVRKKRAGRNRGHEHSGCGGQGRAGLLRR